MRPVTPMPARSGPRCATGWPRTCRPGRCRRWTPPRGSRGTGSGSASWRRRGCRWCPGRAEYGGRDASLLDWLVFEEEYHAAGAPVRVGQNGLFLLAPTLFAHGTAEQRDRLLPPMARADEVWAQAWSEPEAGSDLAAIRSRAAATDGGWLLSGTKTWSSRAAFADRAFGLFRTDPGGGAAPRPDLPDVRPARRRRDGAPDPPARRRDRVRGDLPGRRVRARRRRDRRARRRLADRDEHRQPRARAVAAQPGTVRRGGRPAGRAVAAGRRPGRHGAARPGRGRVDRRAGLPAAHARDRRAGSPRAARWAPRPAWARCSGPSSTSRCTRPRWTCSGRGPRCATPGRTGAGWTATCSPWPARSTRAPTRSSAP